MDSEKTRKINRHKSSCVRRSLADILHINKMCGSDYSSTWVVFSPSPPVPPLPQLARHLHPILPHLGKIVLLVRSRCPCVLSCLRFHSISSHHLCTISQAGKRSREQRFIPLIPSSGIVVGFGGACITSGGYILVEFMDLVPSVQEHN